LCGAEEIKTAAAGQRDEAVTGDWAKKDMARKKNNKYVMQGTVFDFGSKFGLRILKPI
jgi:UTP-glucose-1-phosphate uridylyltransferase